MSGTRPLQSQGGSMRGGGSAPVDPADPAQNPALRGAEIGRGLVAWMHERALERTLNASSAQLQDLNTAVVLGLRVYARF